MSELSESGQPAAPLSDTVIVIPALNEESCVAETVARWQSLGPLEIRVVDNASTDATAAKATVAGATVLHESRRGYGAAAWQGVQQLPAACAWVLICSADGSDRLDAEEFRLWRRHAANGADLIAGDRVSRVESRDHLKAAQSFGNWLCCFLIRLGWGQTFRDMGSLRWIRRDALEQLNLQDRGFGWNVEMQVRAIEQGMRIVEIPVAYFPRTAGTSKISGNLLGTVRAGVGILRMFGRLNRTRQPLRPPATVEAKAGLAR